MSDDAPPLPEAPKPKKKRIYKKKRKLTVAERKRREVSAKLGELKDAWLDIALLTAREIRNPATPPAILVQLIMQLDKVVERIPGAGEELTGTPLSGDEILEAYEKFLKDRPEQAARLKTTNAPPVEEPSQGLALVNLTDGSTQLERSQNDESESDDPNQNS